MQGERDQGEATRKADGGNGEQRPAADPEPLNLTSIEQTINVLMSRARAAQVAGAATAQKIGKEGPSLEAHLGTLFGLLRGIHDNQTFMLIALASLMAHQSNSNEALKGLLRIARPAGGNHGRIAPGGIVVPPDFARRR